MVGRIGPPSHSHQSLAPRPKGLQPTSDEMSAYLKACQGGHETCVRAFLKSWPTQADVQWTESKMTALLCAAKGGHEGIVKLLIDNKANLSATTKDGMNALMLAAQSGNESLVTFLIGKGFKANGKDNEGRSVLHHYVFGGDNDRETGVADVLIKHGANINEPSAAGLKPLQWALSLGRKLVFRSLLNLGADISDPALPVVASQIDEDFLHMLQQEPERREKAITDAIEQGTGSTLKLRKPFTVSTSKIEKKPPQDQKKTDQSWGAAAALRQPAPTSTSQNIFGARLATRSWTA